MQIVWADTEIEADLHTFQDLGVEVQRPQFYAQSMPAAIKVGLQISLEDIYFTKQYSIPIVLDADFLLQKVYYKKSDLIPWFSLTNLLVLDTHEAELILGYKITSHQSMQIAAHELLSLGNQNIFLLGEHSTEVWCHDYWTNGVTSFWLTQNRLPHTSESRSILSAAITASLALGYSLEDAIIIAKMYTHQTMRRTQTGFDFRGFPEDEIDLPYLASTPLYEVPKPFKRCHRLGLYPVVDSFSWVELLLNVGVKTIQLRIKERTETLEKEIQRSIALAKKHSATLYINDYWELALKFEADGVHLGQADLDAADVDAIRKRGLLLGVSTHCYYEVAKAHAINPSYIAIGPIYPTTSKVMPFLAQGIERLKRWQRTLNYPLVAIGGINIERVSEVVTTGVQGVALISAITKAQDPRKATEQLLKCIKM
ncbi:phosphomethylpyrimidine kinase/thiamin-phosphate pyrophosphorylase [Legionella sainthelensi]|uniref:Thiamine-phosphate synthase n=1 Tax=Legionella sainthelensi TaxID=28087 RepID=A0A0W0YC76_9GAMM|nr:thiamine phosphate synthase [Legionella sainthelensi]KTD54190.1 phosphomethylpyrimidine kinase/thiamin-phosphate pyrophosphorylase [Legionella sainthelensi]VEH29711.1 phosphomethylpyrimidine kinase/thiamin-phosphate pyrophosphorylase [Legionella sainthelensi]